MRRKRNRKRRTKRRRRVMRGGFPKGTVVRFSPFGISQEGWRFLPRPQATDLNTRRQIAGRLGIYPMAGARLWRGVVTSDETHENPYTGARCVNVREEYRPPDSPAGATTGLPLGPSIDIRFLSPVPRASDLRREGSKIRHPRALEEVIAVAPALPSGTGLPKKIISYLKHGGERRRKRRTRRKHRRKRKTRRKMKKTRRRRYLRRKRRNKRKKIGGGPPWRTTDFHVGDRLKWISIRIRGEVGGGGGGGDEDEVVRFSNVFVPPGGFRVLENPDGPMHHQLFLRPPGLRLDQRDARGMWVTDSDIVDFERYEPESGERLKWIRIKNWYPSMPEVRVTFSGVTVMDFMDQGDAGGPMPQRLLIWLGPGMRWVNIGDIVDFERYEPEPEP